MNMEQLELFLDVIKTHSINKTAANFFITQQSASFSLKKLEKELDLVLLERTPLGVTLTDDGAIATKYFKKIYADYIELKSLKFKRIQTTIILQFPLIYTLKNPSSYMILEHFNNIRLLSQIYDNQAVFEHACQPNLNEIYIFYTLCEDLSESFSDEKTISDCFLKDKLCLLVDSAHPLVNRKYFTSKNISSYPLSIYYPYVNLLNHGENFFGLEVASDKIKYTPSTVNAIINSVKHSDVVAPLPHLLASSLLSVDHSLRIVNSKPIIPIYWWCASSAENSDSMQNFIKLFVDNLRS